MYNHFIYQQAVNYGVKKIKGKIAQNVLTCNLLAKTMNIIVFTKKSYINIQI